MAMTQLVEFAKNVPCLPRPSAVHWQCHCCTAARQRAQCGIHACGGHQRILRGAGGPAVSGNPEQRGDSPERRVAGPAGPGPALSHGWICLDVLHPGAGHWQLGCPVRPLLHVAIRPGAAFFLVLSGLYGLDDGRGAVRQFDPAGVFLGADQPVFVFADRLLAPPQRRAHGRAHGADSHRRRGAVLVGGGVAARPYRRQL